MILFSLGLAFLLHLILLSEAPLAWRAVATLILTALLPGTLLVEWLLGRSEANDALLSKANDALLSKALLELWERSLYSVGAGISVMILIMLALSYLPGGLEFWQTVLAFDFVLVILLLLLVGSSKQKSPPPELGGSEARRGGYASFGTTRFLPKEAKPRNDTLLSKGGRKQWLLMGLLTLLLVGGFYRLAGLNYSEFQGDEARAVLWSAAVIQGYDDVLFRHKKGPTEILLPAVLYSLTGQLNELTARLPFALANLAGLFAIFLLGWRLIGPLAGWTAAILLALDGYFIAFARIVQYQSIVFLMSVLVVLILYRGLRIGDCGLRQPLARAETAAIRNSSAYLTLAALFLATGLLSHYEAIFATIPATYLLWQWGVKSKDLEKNKDLQTPVLRSQRSRIKNSYFLKIRAMIIPIVTGGAILVSFYLPFVLHPNFSQTVDYLADERIGSRFPVNNLADFFLRTTLYSTIYYLLALIILLTTALTLAYWPSLSKIRTLSHPFRTERTQDQGRPLFLKILALSRPFFPTSLDRCLLILALSLPLGLFITLWHPTWLAFGETDWMVIPFGLLFLGLWLIPHLKVEERLLWLWLSIPMLIAFFFTRDPRTHVYVFFMPWALLCGMIVQQAYNGLLSPHYWRDSGLRGGVLSRHTRTLAVAISLALLLMQGSYVYWVFIYDKHFTQTWQKPALFWTMYEPIRSAIFGFPHKSGWKTVGALYQEGVLAADGAYDSNNRVWISEWYSQGAEYCEYKPTYFFVDAFKGKSKQPELIEKLQNRSYQLFGTVLVDEQPGLYIYQKSEARGTTPFLRNDTLPPEAAETPITPQTFIAAEYERRFDDYPVYRRTSLSGHSMMLSGETVGARHKVRYRLGEGFWLVGYTLERSHVQPGETVIVTLFWQVTEQVEQNFTVFNQIIGPNQAMVGQRDGEPICTDGSTTNWEVDELYSQRYAIPIAPDAQAGTYPLLTGMYQLETLERLPVYDESGQPIEGNAIELTTITIEANDTRTDEPIP